MSPANKASGLHLISGVAFLIAGGSFMMLAFINPKAHRFANFPVGIALLLAGLLQFLAYRKKSRA